MEGLWPRPLPRKSGLGLLVIIDTPVVGIAVCTPSVLCMSMQAVCDCTSVVTTGEAKLNQSVSGRVRVP